MAQIGLNWPIWPKAKGVLKTETLEAVADRGYFSSMEILACHEARITVTLPKPQTLGAKSGGRSASRTLSICQRRTPLAVQPASNCHIAFRARRMASGLRRCWTTACQDCSLKSQCTTGPERRIPRWEHEHLLDAVQ